MRSLWWPRFVLTCLTLAMAAAGCDGADPVDPPPVDASLPDAAADMSAPDATPDGAALDLAVDPDGGPDPDADADAGPADDIGPAPDHDPEPDMDPDPDQGLDPDLGPEPDQGLDPDLGPDPDQGPEPDEGPPPPDLVEVLDADGRFVTLLAALDVAGLTDTLREPGLKTLFAPTDAAFEALSAADPERLPALLADPPALAAVLRYHLVEFDVPDDELNGTFALNTVEGRPLRVEGGVPVVLNGEVAVGDMLRSRTGLAHAIDGVLEPPAPCAGAADCAAPLTCGGEAHCLPPPLPLDLIATLAADGRFEWLLALIGDVGLADALRREVTTVFAPTDAAVEGVDFAGVDPARLLGYLLVPGDRPAASLVDRELLTTRGAPPLRVERLGAALHVGGVAVVERDHLARNGRIHVVDGPLAPPAPAPVIDCSAPTPIDAPGLFVGSTAEGEDQAQASCGGGAESADTVFALSLDEGGPVCLSTRGSEFDTVLYVRVGDCNRAQDEVACSDNSELAGGDGRQSAIELDVEAGATYYVVVDGVSDFATGFFAAGDFVLDVRRGACDAPRDVIDELRLDGRFTILLDALARAGLEDALRDPGPYTVLAPTDDAFEALAAADPGLLPALLAEPAALAPVLRYHVVEADLDADALAAAGVVETLEGRALRAERRGEGVELNQSATGVDGGPARNGGYLALDAVLLPPEACAADGDCEPGLACADGEGICLPSRLPPPIPEVLAADPQFATLLAGLASTGLVEVLAEPGPWTLFAPSNDAFAALGQAAIQALFDDPVALAEVMAFHIVPGRYDSDAVIAAAAAGGLVTLDALFASVALDADGVWVGDAPIGLPDLAALNGVVHGVDGVMMPRDACAMPHRLDLGGVFRGSTADAADHGVASCAGGGDDGPEVAHRFVAQAAGRVCFTTMGSTFDTLVYVTAGGCDGPQIGCHDDIDFFEEVLTSRVEIAAEAGVEYHVFVASYGPGEHGAYTLRAQPGACPAP